MELVFNGQGVSIKACQSDRVALAKGKGQVSQTGGCVLIGQRDALQAFLGWVHAQGLGPSFRAESLEDFLWFGKFLGTVVYL